MDYTINITELADGTTILWCLALGVLQTCACWNDAELIFNTIGVGAP
jgi:hypothetical protein